MLLEGRSRSRTIRGRVAMTVVLVTTVSVLFAGNAAAALRTAKTHPTAKPALTIGVSSFSATIGDPAKTVQGQGTTLFSLAYAPLIHLTANGALQPALATSWRYVHGPAGPNTGFELTLRHDAHFADGTLVTAQSVRAWLLHFSKTSVNASFMPLKSVNTIGKWRVRFNLKAPVSEVPLFLADASQQNWGFVASPKVLRGASSLTTTSDGAGPYVLSPSQSVIGDHYTFVPNKYFYNPSAIRFSKVVVRILASPSSMLQALQSGQLDVAYGDTTTAGAAARAGFTVTKAPVLQAGLLFLDRSGTMSKPLSDVRVRQALNYAVDRRAIAKALVGRFGAPTSEYRTADGWDPKYQNYYSYSPAKARSLLAAAGYSGGFTLAVDSNGPWGALGDQLTQAVAQYYKAVGVNVDDTDASASQFASGLFGKQFPAIENPLSIVPMGLGANYFGATAGGVNVFGLSDPTLGRIYLAGQRSTKPGKYWEEMSRRFTQQAVGVPVFLSDGIWYSRKSVGGVAFGPYSTYPLASGFTPK